MKQMKIDIKYHSWLLGPNKAMFTSKPRENSNCFKCCFPKRCITVSGKIKNLRGQKLYFASSCSWYILYFWKLWGGGEGDIASFIIISYLWPAISKNWGNWASLNAEATDAKKWWNWDRLCDAVRPPGSTAAWALRVATRHFGK